MTATDIPFCERYCVKPGTRVDLNIVDANETGDFVSKKQAKSALKHLREDLVNLQERFYAWDKRSLLIVLQATDTGGEDGTIEHAMQGTNPQGVEVTSFKVPSAEELAHDYLWRIHKAVPARRMIGIFNRSHYEDVLVVRVHDLVPESVWCKRYDEINAFEKLLVDSGATILKFYLHISKDE